MDKSLEGSKSRHPAFMGKISKMPAFDINTIIRYDLHTGMFTVNADIEDVDTIYDEKFGGWRKAETDEEKEMNKRVIDTLAQVCVMLNQMVDENSIEKESKDESR